MKLTKISLNVNDLDLKMVETTIEELNVAYKELGGEQSLPEEFQSVMNNLLSSSMETLSEIKFWKSEAMKLLQVTKNTKFGSLNQLEEYLRINQPSAGAIAVLIQLIENDVNSKRAKHAIESHHNRPGGSRDVAKQIRDIWASGKYTSRDICAEQECAYFNVAYSTARKALHGTPKPSTHK